jgi:hypothetical protein
MTAPLGQVSLLTFLYFFPLAWGTVMLPPIEDLAQRDHVSNMPFSAYSASFVDALADALYAHHTGSLCPSDLTNALS